MDFLSKVKNYEQGVFDEFMAKRNKLLNTIENLNFETLDKKQKIIFIENFKNVVEPLKTSIQQIDTFNNDTDFKNQENVNTSTQVNFVYLLYLLLFTFSEEETLETEISESL
jgi:hypothetical protein